MAGTKRPAAFFMSSTSRDIAFPLLHERVPGTTAGMKSDMVAQ
jgi:hypothetical protein